MNLQEFSARKFGPEKSRGRFRTILGKVAHGSRKCTKSTFQKSEIWLVLGRHGCVWAGNGSVWIQNCTQTYWTPFGPYLGHSWTSLGSFLDYWTIAGLLLAGPYCCPIHANLVLCTVFLTLILLICDMHPQRQACCSFLRYKPLSRFNSSTLFHRVLVM